MNGASVNCSGAQLAAENICLKFHGDENFHFIHFIHSRKLGFAQNFCSQRQSLEFQYELLFLIAADNKTTTIKTQIVFSTEI